MQNNNYKTEYKDYSGHIAIMISTDRQILDVHSQTHERMKSYAKLYKELHIIVFAKPSLGKESEISISFGDNSQRLKIYSTQSKSRFFYITDAYKIGKKLINNFRRQSANTYVGEINTTGKNENKVLPVLITCQDPFETGIAGLLFGSYIRKNNRRHDAESINEQKKNLSISLRPELLLQLHTDVFSPYFSNHSFLNRVRVLIAKFTIPKADVVRVVSKKIADSLVLSGLLNKGVNGDKNLALELAVKKIILKPISVDVDYIKNTLPAFNLEDRHPELRQSGGGNTNSGLIEGAKSKIVLMISRLEPEKNIEMAIRAFKCVVDESQKNHKDNLFLIIIGDGSLRKKLEKLAIDLDVSNRVIFTGWVKDQLTLVSYLKGSTISLVTSWYEGYGMVFKEAEAACLKIVSTDVGIAREIGAKIVGHNEDDVCKGIVEGVGVKVFDNK